MKNSKLFILIFILFSTKNVLTVIRKIELVNEEKLIEFHRSTNLSLMKTPDIQKIGRGSFFPHRIFIAAVLDHNLKLEYFQFDHVDDLLVFEQMLKPKGSTLKSEALAIAWYFTDYPLNEILEQSEVEDAEPSLNEVVQNSSAEKSESKESKESRESSFCEIS